MMSSTGQQKRTLLEAARKLWALGGVRAYYRGLTVSQLQPSPICVESNVESGHSSNKIGLCGVFPSVKRAPCLWA
jgi:hypothetical protein